MGVLEFLKILNNSYGNLLNTIVTIVIVYVGVHTIKDMIATRVSSVLPYLRIEIQKVELEDKFTGLIIKANPFNLEENDNCQEKIFGLDILNYGIGPAINVSLLEYGTVKTVNKKGDLEIEQMASIFSSENLTDDHILVAVAGNDFYNIAISPNDKRSFQFLIKYKKQTSKHDKETVGLNFSDNLHYIMFEYNSLSSNRKYYLFTIMKFFIHDYDNEVQPMLRIHYNYNFYNRFNLPKGFKYSLRYPTKM